MALQRLLAGNAGNRCYFVPLDKDESCPTADLSNIGRSNGSAYSTSKLLHTTLVQRDRNDDDVLLCYSRTLLNVRSRIM